jgi:hypothetical protein
MTTSHVRLLRLVPLVVAAVFTAACSGGDDAPTPAESAESTTTTSEPSDADDSGDGLGMRRVEGSVAADLEQTHGNGVTVAVTGVSAEGDGVFVDMEAFNPNDWEVELAWLPEATYLVVDGGRAFALRPPVDNERVAIPAAGELTARLAFVGRIPDAGAEVRLVINSADGEPDGPDDDQWSEVPSFEFELPNPGVGS